MREQREYVQGKGGKMPVAEKTEHRDTDERIVEIELERLRSFTNHPFRVQADSQMIELQDSIKKYGMDVATWEENYGEKTPPKATFEERLRIYQREADQQHTQRNYHSRDKGAR